METHRPPKDFSVRGYVFYPTFQMENSIRTQENKRFKLFFAEVQKTAQESGRSFFLDTGEEKAIIFNGMELDEMFGWLIPDRLVSEFERDFIAETEGEKWADFTTWCIPSVEDGKLIIEFKDFG